MRNITVDSESTVEILSGVFDGLCSEPYTALARINFTGVAIYHVASAGGQPLQFALDGISSNNSLEPSGNWRRTGLEPKNHTLVLCLGEKGDVGTWVYTVPDSLANAAGPSSQGILPVSALSTSTAPEAQQNRGPIIAGSIVGFIIICILVGITVHLYRNAKARDSRFIWKAPVPALPTSQEYSFSKTGLTSVGVRSPSPTEMLSVNTHRSNSRLLGGEPFAVAAAYQGGPPSPPPHHAIPPTAVTKSRERGEQEESYELPLRSELSPISFGPNRYTPQDPQLPLRLATASSPQAISPLSHSGSIRTEGSKSPLKLEPNRRVFK